MKIKLSVLLVSLLFLVEFLPTSVYNLYSLCVAIIAIISLAIGGYRRRYAKVITLPILTYILTTAITYIVHFQGLESIERILYYFSSVILIRLIVIYCIRSEDDIQHMLNIIVIIFGIYATLCLFETFTGTNYFDILFRRIVADDGANSTRFGFARAHGVCTVSINNAMLLNVGWMLTAYKLFNQRKSSIIYITCYVLIGFSSVMTLSRTVIILGIACQIFMAVKCGFSWLVKRVLLAMVMLLVVILILPDKLSIFKDTAISMFAPILVMFDNSYSIYLSREAQGFGERFILWRWVLEDIKNNWVVGYGYGIEFSQFRHILNSGLVKNSIEVQWLTMLFRGGVVLLIGFLCFYIDSIRIIFSKAILSCTEKLSLTTVMRIMIIALTIFWFTCSANEELRIFYMILALYEVEIGICKKDSAIPIEKR